jgi:pimeloyl-ACP methyl ester carboxylesterase
MIHVAVDEDSRDLTAVRYRTTTVDGLSIFYREAGDPSNPTLVLLHGFPSSSVMFRDLIPRLADRFHLIAPDYPGFGRSDSPPPSSFSYTFDRLGEVVDQFLQQRRVARTACTCKTTAARSGFAWRSRIPSEWRR